MALVVGNIRLPVIKALHLPSESTAIVAKISTPALAASTAPSGKPQKIADTKKTELKKPAEPLTIPKPLTDIGLMLFVAAVGFQAGPRFFSVFRARGKAFLLVGFCATFAGAVATFILARMFHLSSALATGLYTGAVTNTPAMAAARDVVQNLSPKNVMEVSVGYGLAYPFSVIGVTLFVQLLPKLLKKNAQQAAEEARKDDLAVTPGLERRKFRINNPEFSGQTIENIVSINHSDAKISRIKRENTILAVLPETCLKLNDMVMAVGTTEELDKLQIVIGEVVTESMADPTGNVVSEEIVVSSPRVIGRTLSDLGTWEEFGVVVTRVRANGAELSPTGQYELEPADVLRVVGTKNDVDSFANLVGEEERRLDETSYIPVAAGIAMGMMLGLIPIPLPGHLTTTISLAGGVFIVALLLGHFGKIGPIRVYVPTAANLFARELGLVIFLAGAGLEAGEKFGQALATNGPILLFTGALITLVTAGVATLLLLKALKWNMLASAGALSSVMTNPPALNASTHLADSDASAVAFASVYPVAIISKIIFAQLLFLALRM